ncbi:helix-turn-helix domain-containing protein [Aquibacillus albus]|uniref:Sugar diacid utilization regulator n=1 Tax=Aquibacillus albus TaxID=1168171 RepID=A0ABS2MWT0_9BACI|nr:helix-turn-helix domain-containing protein [Aquibacillus albus]MBM7570352.1 sugar diacid utilization regulator [Aquibacillus albus]
MENEKRLMSLINAVKVLNSTRDLDEVLHQLIKEVLNVIEGANASVLFLYDKRIDKLYAKSAIGFNMDYLKQILMDPGEGMSGRTFLSKKGKIFSSKSDTTSGMSNISDETKRLYTKAMGAMEYPMSAISVPLISKGECIGVLTVDIYKEKVQFDETDLRLLETFGVQASIAIENATLFSQNERTKRIHEELSKVSLSKGGLSDITEALAGLLNKRVVVFNEFMDPMAVSDQDAKALSNEVVEKHPMTLTEAIKQHSISHYRMALLNGNYQVYFFPIQTDKLNLGVLTIFVDDQYELDPLDRFAVEQASTIFAMEMNRRDRLIADDFSYSGYVLEQLIHSPYEELSSNYLAKINFPEKENHQYVIAHLYMKDPLVSFQEVSEKKQQFFRLLCREISRLPYKTLIHDHNMEITMMFTMSSMLNEEQVFNQLTELFEKIIKLSNEYYQLSILVGLGQVVDKLKRIRLSYRDAKRCVQFLQSTNQEETILTYPKLGSYRLFLKTDRSELKEYVDSVIGTIIAHDQTHDTELLKTLKVYLESNQNMTESAKALFVHTNTIKYRLKSIKEILKVDKVNGRKAFELQLGLYILEYLGMKD